VSVTGIASGGLTLATGAFAAASGWTSPTGLAAFITALVGAGAFIWSVYQGVRRRETIDLDAAEKLAKLLREADDE
jgi:hypothetical protein